ncbi:ABC-2 family transporter protein [Verrucomicrobium sp. GAS474]|uniref:ABC transporter permease subunit n=1 Tax=Verrucomicrobium sp. GAS474 TaxID=1882831 RepID=UPI00087CEF34|nr:ABC transporter permease subunit [Verrucomicrobium sp. GAS474]SDT93670.1 ABC-2 family transporter protein [Verrucomicrobium sp. GAS474]
MTASFFLRHLRPVWAIARNTCLEAFRQKVLNLLLLFSLVAIGSANLFTNFTYDEQLKFLKDFSFGAMTVFGTLIAVMGTAQTVQGEIESRTLQTILIRPVGRGTFLLGKFAGIALVLAAAFALMTTVFAGVLIGKERSLVAAERASVAPGHPLDEATAQRIAAIEKQCLDPQLGKALLLTAAKTLFVTGFALLFATVSTSTIFTVSTTLLVYLVGHLEGIAREAWTAGGGTWLQKAFLGAVSVAVPDFGSYGILDDVLAGTAVPWGHVLSLLGYTAVYLLILLGAARLLFEAREL